MRCGRLFFLMLLLVFTGCAGKFIKLPEGGEVAFPAILEDVKGEDLIFVGETHDSSAHHSLQLRVIKALKGAGVNLAIGLEMFPSETQGELDRWVSGSMTREEFVGVYYRNWNVPWRLYRPIFFYARDEKIPLVGLNVSRDTIHRVFTKGFSALTAEETALLGNLKCDVDEKYEKLIKEAMKEHKNGAAFIDFCQAQVVWDTAMARRAEEYLRKNPGVTMVVLSGGAHSWKRGIPRRLGEEFSYGVLIPEMDEPLTRGSITFEDADYLWVDP